MPLYIGLMSGTSADGIDAALVDLHGADLDLLSTLVAPVPNSMRQAVHDFALSGNHEISRLQYLDSAFADLFGRASLELCAQANIQPSAVIAIGSHGQTLRHQPPTLTAPGYSLQVGDPNRITQQTGITTITDFRRRDMAAGGQGAPLASGLHGALLQSQRVDRVIINTGGIANITHLPVDALPRGFDTGPANNLMDSWYQLHRSGPFDAEGRWALSGQVNDQLLALLLCHPYFALPAPKSTGREAFNLPWLQRQLADHGFVALSPEDVQATLLALSVESIARGVEIVDSSGRAEVYLCGGGAHNTALLGALRQRLQPRLTETTQAVGMDPDWVEAAAFAWMARNTLEHRPGNVPSVTGAREEVILGGIYWAN